MCDENLICEKHKVKKEWLGGCSAHPDNLYCPECNKEKNSGAFGTQSLSNKPSESAENIINAVKLITKLNHEKVAPFSMGNICGVNIMSIPTLDNNMIMVSDDIYLLLKDLSDFNKEKNNDF